MSFNCSQFQPQLKLQNKPFRDQVFQVSAYVSDHCIQSESKLTTSPMRRPYSSTQENEPLGRETKSSNEKSVSRGLRFTVQSSFSRFASTILVRVDEFHQVRHDYKHFFRCVPFLSLLQSHERHTHFAGAWALVNAHETAVISGLAAAYALGAGYPEELAQDDFATKCFQGYLSICYRKWGKSAKKKGILEKVPLVVKVFKGSVNSSSSTLR